MKRPRQHNGSHLDFLRQLPCCVCGDPTSTEAAHIRYSDSRAAKYSPGMAEKSDDCFAVPLCGRCHREQHRDNERRWWAEKKIDPVQTAAFLYCASGDHERGERIVREARGS